ncbi:hypothetical protein H9657_18285 [Cellulomonas sp. Sa3CUA2]|uniref:Glycosyltransferase 2-like domain-containing protein n=1 Tax=Cellulomonas avistercoris TaxID=2762242 RepID=A0ABR8QIG9_9CELL|nr:hypothetical protein [Cellulomonas avistercoris]MBD7920225.1 hypothetical protein [Cellulomonas avistercoris]
MTTGTLVCLVVDGTTDPGPGVRAARRLHDVDGRGVDVLVLDDRPDAGPADTLTTLCREEGTSLYRSPRPLGAVPAGNLALAAARACGHDMVVLADAGLVLAGGAVAALRQGAGTDVACVCAWSDDAGEYSIHLGDAADRYVERDAVDWLAAVLGEAMGDDAFDVPLVVGACTAFSTAAVATVGLLDTAYPDLATATADWSLRARASGLHTRLAPRALAVRSGGVPTTGGTDGLGRYVTGPVEGRGWRLVRQRFPQVPDQLDAFRTSRLVENARYGAARHVVVAGARRHGWTIDVGRDPGADDWTTARCHVRPDDPATWTVRFRGQHLLRRAEAGEDVEVSLTELFVRRPDALAADAEDPAAAELVARVARRVATAHVTSGDAAGGDA